MRPEHRTFSVHPVVVPGDAEAEITIRPLFGHVVPHPPLPRTGGGEGGGSVDYEVTYYPCEEFSLRSGWPERNKPPVRRVDGALVLRQYFEAEQEHVLILEAVEGGNRRRLGEFRIYSVGPDLAGRLPWKGDVHMHSSYSDGREAPAYVAAACRSIGLDFMALTDHGQYEPSLEAIRAFDAVQCDLRICPGEEVHPPGNPVHMVNFGGRSSVNALFHPEDAYRAGVEEMAAGLGSLPPGVDRFQYASTVWSLDRIREVGGLGIFCHPYWFTSNRYTPSGALTSCIFETQPYDAYELIGGYHLHEVASNTLQVARYHEERVHGRRIPIVGVSDAHGCERGELFGWYYTVAFAPSCEFDDLKAAIKGLWSVAVEALPNQEPRAFGPFRLAKYAQFLMREVFPLHDELCVEEGRLMRTHAAGDPEAAPALSALGGRVAGLYGRLFAA
ncbi:MAG: hypothetical protein FJX72_01670 [Armatimonadetes bacterium]|nr:hypothetical protein [Armatimonadota bacterium]